MMFNFIRNWWKWTVSKLTEERGDIGQMLTPPKSKSPWEAMTSGSTGGWASFAGPSNPYNPNDPAGWGWVGPALTLGAGAINPLLSIGMGAMGSMGGGTGFQGTDYGWGNILPTVLGGVGGYGLGSMGAGLAGGLGNVFGGQGLSSFGPGFQSGLQKYLGTDLIPGMKGSNPLAWFGGDKATPATGGTMLDPYAGTGQQTGLASGGATSQMFSGGQPTGYTQFMSQGGQGFPTAAMAQHTGMGRALTGEGAGRMAQAFQGTPQQVASTGKSAMEIAASGQGGPVGNAMARLQASGMDPQTSANIIDTILGGSQASAAKDSPGALSFLSDPMKMLQMLGVGVGGLGTLPSMPEAPPYGDITRQHLSGQALTKSGEKAQGLRDYWMEPFEMDAESLALADELQGEMERNWKKSFDERVKQISRYTDDFRHSGEYDKLLNDSKDALDDSIAKMRAELMYKAKADWAVQRFNTVAAELQWDRQQQLQILYGDIQQASEQFMIDAADIMSLRQLAATGGLYLQAIGQGGMNAQSSTQFPSAGGLLAGVGSMLGF